jgi:hypothetical protein
MSDWIQKMLESKRQARQNLAALPFSEKVKLLEKLRDRSRAIAASSLRKQAVRGLSSAHR